MGRSQAYGWAVPRAGAARNPFASAIADAIARESLLALSLAIFVGTLIWRLPTQFNQDAWLALVAGREIVSHGLPHTETLTIWAQGKPWIDQQWLSHLAFYGSYRIGGAAALAVLHAVLAGGAYLLAVVAARRLGGSARSVLFVLPLVLWCLVSATWQIRTQSFAYPLFAALVWLLATDSRAPSRRVFAVLPLLVLWGNLHGSVVLGVGLVVLRGLVSSGGRRVLVALAPLTLFVTPYGLHVAGYYGSTLLNPAFSAMVNEWQPVKLGALTFPYFALAAGTLWLLGRCRRTLTAFEQLALISTCAAGLLASRNMGWFAFAALMLVPRALDAARGGAAPDRRPAPGLHAAAAVGSAAFVFGFLIWTAARPASFFTAPFPSSGATAVARLAARAPQAKIYADVKYADWLVWREPQLRGRVAYDARFELLPARRIFEIYNFDNPDGDPWRTPTRGYSILLLDGGVSAGVIRTVRSRTGWRVAYASHELFVVRTLRTLRAAPAAERRLPDASPRLG